MAYCLKINENYQVARSRHTGAIGFWQRNEVYDYWAALAYLPEGQKLTVRKLIEWAELAGEKPADVIDTYVKMIRDGGHGMIPQPDFALEINF